MMRGDTRGMMGRLTGIMTHIHETLQVVGLLETGHGRRTRTSHTDTTNSHEGINNGAERLIGKAEDNLETTRLPNWEEVVQIAQLLDKGVDGHSDSDVTHVFGSLDLIPDCLGLGVELTGNPSSDTGWAVGVTRSTNTRSLLRMTVLARTMHGLRITK
jgi:hypothetical protein